MSFPLVAPEDRAWRSVTGLVEDVINPGEAMLKWANNEGLHGRTIGQKDRQTTMSSGSEIHRALESSIDGGPPDPEDYAPSARAGVRGVKTWKTSRQVDLLAVETELKSDTLRVSGREDYLRRCKAPRCACGGEGVVVGDLKTGSLRTYPEYHLQPAAYWYMRLENFPDLVVCTAEILCIDREGNVRVVPCIFGPEQFRLAAEWHTELMEGRGRMFV